MARQKLIDAFDVHVDKVIEKKLTSDYETFKDKVLLEELRNS